MHLAARTLYQQRGDAATKLRPLAPCGCESCHRTGRDWPSYYVGSCRLSFECWIEGHTTEQLEAQQERQERETTPRGGMRSMAAAAELSVVPAGRQGHASLSGNGGRCESCEGKVKGRTRYCPRCEGPMRIALEAAGWTAERVKAWCAGHDGVRVFGRRRLLTEATDAAAYMTARQRLVWTLRTSDRLSIRQIADRIGRSIGAVHELLSNAQRRADLFCRKSGVDTTKGKVTHAA